MNNELFYLQRIADALERIARHLEGEVPVTMQIPKEQLKPSSDSYEAAVGRLVDMPDDIPPEPAKDTTPVTKAEIVAALNLHARLHGIESSKKILAGFAPKLDQVPEDQYPDLLAMLKVAP